MPKFSTSESDRQAVERLFYGRLPFDFVAALFAFDKKARVQKLIHGIKYHFLPEMAYWIGQVLGEEMRRVSLSWPADIIVPVPLHPKRQRRRGFNQSAWFARGLSEKLGLPVREDILVRVVNTKSQTGMNKTRRWENVREAFMCLTSVQGLRIILTDDVLTTGATLEACGKAVLKAGARSINIAVMASAFGHD
jgi:ComF family protein